jgi:two-component system invasion response regulator UvrY
VIKVCVADDHRLVREGLKKYLAEASDIVVTDEAKSGQEVLSKVGKKKFDVMILDISMPGRNGLDIMKQLKQLHPDIKILVLSMHSEEEYAERSLKAGASGYLTKNIGPDELVLAVRTVSKDKKYITPSLAEILANNLGGRSEGQLHETLSDREYEVMCMIASGKSIKDIADELALSSKTISAHRAHILEKLNIKNNSQLIHYAMQNQMVD